MAFPKTFDALVKAGYMYSGQNVCKGCGTRIEWWVTPNKRPIPLDLIIDRDSQVTPHHATCSHVEQFRKPKAG
jgi:hypothetical protein